MAEKPVKAPAKAEKKPKKVKAWKKKKYCPKCGPGFYLAEHKERNACGKCGYMEKKSS